MFTKSQCAIVTTRRITLLIAWTNFEFVSHASNKFYHPGSWIEIFKDLI